MTTKRQMMMSARIRTAMVAGLAAVCSAWMAPVGSAASAVAYKDWPVYRCNDQRTAVTPHALPERLHLQWVREMEPVRGAWSYEGYSELLFDAQHEPVTMGKRIFVPSSATDSVSAFDTETGELRWRFFADGPVRLAPIALRGNDAGQPDRVIFGSDDGCLYCVHAETGELVWRLAAHNPRKVLGNGRLISVWPIRCGPILFKNRLRFMAGAWPTEGILEYDCDPAAPAAGSSARPFRVAGGAWYGQAIPIAYPLACGEQLIFPLARNLPVSWQMNKERGGWAAALGSYRREHDGIWPKTDRWRLSYHAGWFIVGDLIQNPSRKSFLPVNGSLIDDTTVYYTSQKVERLRDGKWKVVEGAIHARSLGVPDSPDQPAFPVLWSLKMDVPGLALKAGPRLYGSLRSNQVFAVTLPAKGKPEGVSWEAKVEGCPGTMIAGDDKLFVVTREGRLHCFGGKKGEPRRHPLKRTELTAPAQRRAAAKQLAAHAALSGGYCIVAGIDDGSLIDAILKETDLRVIAVDADRKRIGQLRERYVSTGLYGKRVELVAGSFHESRFPPYIASLIVSERLVRSGIKKIGDKPFLRHAISSLRPYGGSFCMDTAGADRAAALARAAENLVPGVKARSNGNRVILTREGPLPGAGKWTHNFGDAGHTLMSGDKVVRAPLAVSWYGGEAATRSYFHDRKAWAPSALVRDGRVIVQGPNGHTAYDVYAGQVLWHAPRKVSPRRPYWSLGRYVYRSGGNSPCFHFIVASDLVYIIYPRFCTLLDVTTGKEVKRLSLPEKGLLLGRAVLAGKNLVIPVYQKSGPFRLTAIDRHTGDVRWNTDAQKGFGPMVPVGETMVFARDGGTFVAFDSETGKERWRVKAEKGASWFSYSKDHDVLVASSRNGVLALRGRDGTQLWEVESLGRGFGHHAGGTTDKVILRGNVCIDARNPMSALDIVTGKRRPVLNPFYLTPQAWSFSVQGRGGRSCGYVIGSEHLLTWRLGAGAYCDLTTSGTTTIPGFRSACRNSLIPADGALNAPNFAVGCRCGYSIFTSLGLTHNPDVERWAVAGHGRVKPGVVVRRVGVNFAAPGWRRAENGTEWVAFPETHRLGRGEGRIDVRAGTYDTIERHASFIREGAMKWVGAYAIAGMSRIAVGMSGQSMKKINAKTRTQMAKKTYTVRLVFAELEPHAKPGERVFHVSLSGKRVLESFDIAKAAGGPMRTLVREFKGIKLDPRELALAAEFTPVRGQPLLGGIEIVEENTGLTPEGLSVFRDRSRTSAGD